MAASSHARLTSISYSRGRPRRRLARRGLATLTDEGRQRLLRALIDEIVVTPNRLEIRGVLPGRWVAAVVGLESPTT